MAVYRMKRLILKLNLIFISSQFNRVMRGGETQIEALCMKTALFNGICIICKFVSMSLVDYMPTGEWRQYFIDFKCSIELVLIWKEVLDL